MPPASCLRFSAFDKILIEIFFKPSPFAVWIQGCSETVRVSLTLKSFCLHLCIKIIRYFYIKRYGDKSFVSFCNVLFWITVQIFNKL